MIIKYIVYPIACLVTQKCLSQYLLDFYMPVKDGTYYGITYGRRMSGSIKTKKDPFPYESSYIYTFIF